MENVHPTIQAVIGPYIPKTEEQLEKEADARNKLFLGLLGPIDDIIETLNKLKEDIHDETEALKREAGIK